MMRCPGGRAILAPMPQIDADRRPAVEIPTLALILGCTALWAGLTALAHVLPLWLVLPALVLVLVLHSSLQHEALHGHPTPLPALNAALVFPALGVFVPYARFRDQHLAHHRDAVLTDPYDDPESNYLDPAVWARLPRAARLVLRVNNTLAGRVLIGPAIGLAAFYAGDLRAVLAGERAVIRGWALHLPALAVVILWLEAAGTLGWGAYLGSAYAALGILKIRTFLEHRAHERARGRSVIIEDRGPLAFLFLNNNLHAVHHGHPGVAWYKLPTLYRAQKERILAMNHGYRYRSYREILAQYLLRAKDPVAHPLYPSGE